MDLFNKIVHPLFREGVFQHLENPPGYGPANVFYIQSLMRYSFVWTLRLNIEVASITSYIAMYSFSIALAI